MTVPAPIAGGVGQSLLRRGWVRKVGRTLLVLAAVAGVPLLVVAVTGGQSSVIYWIDVAMFSLFAYTIGFWPLWIVLVVPWVRSRGWWASSPGPRQIGSVAISHRSSGYSVAPAPSW